MQRLTVRLILGVIVGELKVRPSFRRHHPSPLLRLPPLAIRASSEKRESTFSFWFVQGWFRREREERVVTRLEEQKRKVCKMQKAKERSPKKEAGKIELSG